jgi:hypothetical protein
VTVRVGDPYDPSRSSWPEDASYSASGGRHGLFWAVARPSPELVAGVAAGPYRLALARPPSVPFFYVAFAFGAEPWRLVPVSWHRLPATERAAAPGDPDTPLVVVLVDATTGVVLALRAVLMAHGLVSRIHGALEEQARRPWVGEAAFREAVTAAGRRHTPEEMVRRWTMATQGTGLPGDRFTMEQIKRRASGKV